MQKEITKVLTNEGIFETELSLQEAQDAVAESIESGKLLALPLNGTAAHLNIDGEMCPVVNNKTTYLDLSELKILGYAQNTYTIPENKDLDEGGEEEA